MTRKHFAVIARMVREMQISEAKRNYLALHFCKQLASINPLFNRERFIAACKPKPEPTP